MTALPKAVVVGHLKYKIVRLGKSEKPELDGECDYSGSTIRVRVGRKPKVEVANTLLHEIMHAAWDAAGIGKRTDEERVVTMLSNQMTQVIRDNPEVFDWIAEKARS